MLLERVEPLRLAFRLISRFSYFSGMPLKDYITQRPMAMALLQLV